MDDVREKLANALYIRWDYEMLNKDQVSQLEKLFKKHKGKKQIIFELIDSKTKSFVTLNSRNFRSNISNDLIKNLDQIDGFLGYSVNKSYINNYLEKLNIDN